MTSDLAEAMPVPVAATGGGPLAVTVHAKRR